MYSAWLQLYNRANKWDEKAELEVQLVPGHLVNIHVNLSRLQLSIQPSLLNAFPRLLWIQVAFVNAICILIGMLFLMLNMCINFPNSSWQNSVQKAAIKKMDMQATKEFLAELKVLTRVNHLNLVIITLFPGMICLSIMLAVKSGEFYLAYFLCFHEIPYL